MAPASPLCIAEMPVPGFVVSCLEAFAFRVPISTTRKARYGQQTSRSALIVRLTDTDNNIGWGEAFANWPPFGAEHRMRIVNEVLAPIAAGFAADHPFALMRHLEEKVAIPRIKSDEPGPFDQSIAAVDVAAWDLASRKARVPLYTLLGHNAEKKPPEVEVYASGITPESLEASCERALKLGIQKFKLKVGFGVEADRASLLKLRALAGPKARLMADADQAWSPAEAALCMVALDSLGLDWIEEPLRADCPAEHWIAFAAQTRTMIAAGENIRGLPNFKTMINSGVLTVLQPDIIKWGGISRVLSIAQIAKNAGVRLCPHYLGGGVGLVATAHLLAALCNGEPLELDVSDNPLRELLADPFPVIRDGRMILSDTPGLGVSTPLERVASCQL